MTVKGKTKRRVKRYDWPSLEMEFMTLPSMSLTDFAEMHGIPYATLRLHADPSNGDWSNKRIERFKRIMDENRKRLADILHETRRDDISAFKALEDRLKGVALSSLELLFPPEDAPFEAKMAAKNRLEAMTARQLSGIINESLRTLTETGRHRRLLTGQATAIFVRAEAPDIMLPVPLEEARALEMRSRMAQIALNAHDSGSPLDIDYSVLEEAKRPPEVARPIPPDFADL